MDGLTKRILWVTVPVILFLTIGGILYHPNHAAAAKSGNSTFLDSTPNAAEYKDSATVTFVGDTATVTMAPQPDKTGTVTIKVGFQLHEGDLTPNPDKNRPEGQINLSTGGTVTLTPSRESGDMSRVCASVIPPGKNGAACFIPSQPTQTASSR
jgi:hypothetical protein